MGLNKIVVTAALIAFPAFASSRVDEALSFNAESPAAKKVEKKSPKAKVFDSLNTSDTQKTELPKNARHDATGGVFI